MKDKNVAGVLALFLGWVGIHRFYLGQVGRGVLYAVFCWFPLTWIIAFIDAIVLFSMDPDVFDAKYNKQAWKERQYQPDFERRRPSDFDRQPQQRQSSPPPPPQQRKAPADRPNPHKTAGLEKFKDYDYYGAIEDFKKSLDIAPQDIATHFNISCAYALVEDKDKAFWHLDKAVSLGFRDFQKVNEHHALAYLRIQKEFESFEANGFRLGTVPTSKTDEKDLLASQPELLDRLKKLSEMREHGLLTQQEYDDQRQRLMGS
ncbi:MAG: NINE protein [Saprospiraceae bacterium]|nr:NINE protein [Saprospiraceae bacterium]